MTDEELKDTIVYIATSRTFTDSFGDEIVIDREVARAFADALIAAGIGDINEWKQSNNYWEQQFESKQKQYNELTLLINKIVNKKDEIIAQYKHRADKAERALHILAKNALYSVMQSDGAFVKLCYGADTAKCNACNEKCSTDEVTGEMLAECLVTESLKQAEQELLG